MNDSPIGVFDSGYGGLTVLSQLLRRLPGYDFLYLGDNARTPYGTRSFRVVYEYTLEAVKYLFSQNCPLIIIACNTASAKALRNIQQLNLPTLAPDRRVLGVIRPSVEKVAEITQNGRIGVVGTPGTVQSGSYPIELQKWAGGKIVSTVQEPCPLWVPLVENNEIESEGAAYFVRKNLQNLFMKDKELDTLILGCTHYPLLMGQIKKFVPEHIRVLDQGAVVAEKLINYLQRHPEMDARLSRNGKVRFQTTESAENFNEKAALFLGQNVSSETIHL